MLATPLAQAQQAGRVYRVGLIGSRHYPLALDPFVAELRRYGWTQGRDYVLETRYTMGEQPRALALAQELVSRPVDLIVTINTANALAAREASATIPIVMLASGYPVEVGLAASLARPGGTVTGNSIYAGTELFGKYVSLLQEVAPRMRRLGVLWDYAPPNFLAREIDPGLDEIRRATSVLGIELRIRMVPRREDVPPAVVDVARDRVDALFATGGPVLSGVPRELTEFIQKHRLPTLTEVAGPLIRQGPALMSYSPSLRALGSSAAPSRATSPSNNPRGSSWS